LQDLANAQQLKTISKNCGVPTKANIGSPDKVDFSSLVSWAQLKLSGPCENIGRLWHILLLLLVLIKFNLKQNYLTNSVSTTLTLPGVPTTLSCLTRSNGYPETLAAKWFIMTFPKFSNNLFWTAKVQLYRRNKYKVEYKGEKGLQGSRGPMIKIC